MKKRICSALLTILLAMLIVLPVSAGEGEHPPRLVDGAGLLSASQESELEDKLDEISTRQACDVVIVTVDSLDGKTAMAYADDYYDYNGYGFGSERDGILLLVSMESRDWWISTCGYGITAFTDAGMEYIADQFLSDLSDGKYKKAFEKFADLCDDFITEANNGEPYDVGHMPKGKLPLYCIVVDLVIGLFISYCIASNKKSKLRSVVSKYNAADYVRPGSLVLTANWDQMVNRLVTTRVIPRERESSGGSSTHTSSSGSTHGGTGGKF